MCSFCSSAAAAAPLGRCWGAAGASLGRRHEFTHEPERHGCGSGTDTKGRDNGRVFHPPMQPICQARVVAAASVEEIIVLPYIVQGSPRGAKPSTTPCLAPSAHPDGPCIGDRGSAPHGPQAGPQACDLGRMKTVEDLSIPCQIRQTFGRRHRPMLPPRPTKSHPIRPELVPSRPKSVEVDQTSASIM